MDDVVGESVKRPRFFMFSMSVFAAAALSLAALGIFGLLSYTATERQQASPAQAHSRQRDDFHSRSGLHRLLVDVFR